MKKSFADNEIAQDQAPASNSYYDGLTPEQLKECEVGFRGAHDPHETYPEWD